MSRPVWRPSRTPVMPDTGSTPCEACGAPVGEPAPGPPMGLLASQATAPAVAPATVNASAPRRVMPFASRGTLLDRQLVIHAVRGVRHVLVVGNHAGHDVAAGRELGGEIAVGAGQRERSAGDHLHQALA